MIAKYKPLIKVAGVLAALDFIAIITMIANPDLTKKALISLAVVQVAGFFILLVYAMYILLGTSEPTPSPSQSTATRSSKEWLIYVFCGLAALYLFGALRAFVYASARGLNRYQVIIVVGKVALAAYFFYLGWAIRRYIRRKQRDELGG